MIKIKTLFIRDGRRVTNQVEPDCQWVLDGEGVATRKWDGTCCAIIDGKFYKRCEWDVKKGPAPVEWLHHSFDPAQRSGHGWLPVSIGPEDWMHRLAATSGLPDGTYELCGPKLQGNPEKVDSYILVPHGVDVVEAPRDYEGLKQFLLAYPHEGLVWHHPDGRMAKLKGRDFR